MKSLLIVLAVSCLAILSLRADPPVVAFKDAKGTSIHIGSDIGPLILTGAVMFTDQKKMEKLVSSTVDGTTVTQNFDDGGILKISLVGTEVDFDFSQVDPEVTSFVLALRVDYSMHDGGQFQVGDTAGLFPPEKTTNANGSLYGGKNATVLLTSGKGATLEVTFPENTQYMHINDNRFNKDTDQFFTIAVNVERTPGVTQYKLTLK